MGVISEHGVDIAGTTTARTAFGSKASIGQHFYDTTNSTWYVWNGSAWQDSADSSSISTTDLDLGASGTAGTLDIFPTTASKGKLAFAAADSAGNTTTTIVNASQSGARTYTIPDAGASASFVMSAGASTLAGARTFTGGIVVTTAGVTVTDVDIALGTTTGTKIGTAVGQKLGFWNATPVIQQASAAQAAVTPSGAGAFDGADTVNKAVVLAAVQAVETLVNRLRLDLVTTGIIKGSA